MSELVIRPLAQSDLELFENFGCSVKGLTGTKDGEPIMLAGVLMGKQLQAFSVLLDEGRKHPKLMVSMMRRFDTILKSFDAPVYAIADQDENNAHKVLARAGFRELSDGVFVSGESK